MRRGRLIGYVFLALILVILGGFGLAAALGAKPFDAVERLVVGARPPIVVGLLHSLTGPLAISEKSLIDAETLAIEEINASGGVTGRPLVAAIGDGRSEAGVFATQARRLIDDEKASVLFGCWSAESRKAVVSVVEERESLLMFPANYEGIERSSHVIYVGGSANQTMLPAVRWCLDNLKAKRVFVVGSEELWSRCVSEIAKDAIKVGSLDLVGEAYLPLTGGNVEALVESIRAANPDVVLNTMIGTINLSFYAALKKTGVVPEKRPVLAFGIAEDELRKFPMGDFAGQYSALNYFQAVERPENREFIRKFKARFGDDRVTCDAIVAAYNSVMLWAQAANEAKTDDPKIVINHFDRQSLDAPEGIITVDQDSRSIWRPFHVGRARLDGQFDIVWSLEKPIRPLTFPLTRSKSQWQAFQTDLKTRWGGGWSAK